MTESEAWENERDDSAEYVADLERVRCPVSGLRQHVYDYLRGVVCPESEIAAGFFEVGDSVVSGYDVGRKVHLVRLINEIADALGLSESVENLGQIQAFDKAKAQRDAMVLSLDRIAERLREDPDSVSLLPGWMAYNSWAEDRMLVDMFNAHQDGLIPPADALAVPESMMPQPIPVSPPSVSLAIPAMPYAKPRRKKTKRKAIKYEPMRRGIRRSCANLGYEDDGRLWCIELDKGATPARCRSCKAYYREES